MKAICELCNGTGYVTVREVGTHAPSDAPVTRMKCNCDGTICGGTTSAPAQGDETCIYCGESYPKPISLHHSTEECHQNEALAKVGRAETTRPEALRRDVPPEIFDSMAVYMELRIGDKTETIKPSMVADVLDALMRLIRKRWKAEAAESPLAEKPGG